MVCLGKSSKAKGSNSYEYEDFQWAFGLNRLSLDLIGVWPSEAGEEHRTGLRPLRIPLMVLWMMAGVCLPQMYALSLVFRQLPLVVDNLTSNFAALTSSVKLFFLWNNRKVLQPVVKTIMSDWASRKADWERAVMVKQARRARLFTISGYAIMFICFIGFTTPPFFGLSIRIVNNITDPQDGRFFPLQTYYPYESVPDNFFGALVFHASAQCEILAVKMRELLPNCSVDHPRTETEKRFFRNKLRHVVNVHINLIRFVDSLERTFNVLILAQVLCLSLIICCLGFGVIKSVSLENESPPIVQIATLVGTLLNLMIHMLIYCFASELLVEYSLGFFQSIYFSNWYLLPANYSRDILPIMTRCKYPLRLTAGKFFYLSLNAYLNMLKSSVGYISMLLAVSS